jgi:hypothetical protein
MAAKKPKAMPCQCEEFTAALDTGFIDKIGDEIFLASREICGPVRSLLYGPAITHCPFCGTPLVPPEPARTRPRNMN